MKKFSAILLCVLLALGAGCAGVGNQSAKPSGGEPSGGGSKPWKIGYNYLSNSDFVLVRLRDNTTVVVDAFGGTPLAIDDELSVEKIVQDVENMIASGCDGLVLWLPTDQLYLSISQICRDAKVPFVLNDTLPLDPELKAELESNPYCIGGIGPANDVYGASIAEYALAQGYKTCIVNSAMLGSATDTPRLEAFKAIFEAGGGQILDTLYSDGPNESAPKLENALIAHPNPDFIYATGSAFATSAADVLNGKGFDTKILSSGLDATAMEGLADPGNPIEMLNGDFWISGTFSALLMQNYLDGTPIVNPGSSQFWYGETKPFQVPMAQYGLFKKFFMESFCYTPEELRGFSGANTPGFDYGAFMDVVNAYTLENRILARYAEGKVTDGELAAAGIAQ
jgi:ABC-type sugar transport system substrate-binding protein